MKFGTIPPADFTGTPPFTLAIWPDSAIKEHVLPYAS